eukprot:7002871-Prorocentrum_lima.AAC.1
MNYLSRVSSLCAGSCPGPLRPARAWPLVDGGVRMPTTTISAGTVCCSAPTVSEAQRPRHHRHHILAC